jgi:uncharacterized protein
MGKSDSSIKPRLTPALAAKLNKLKKDLAGLERVLVAFSGGVDSTLLLKVASEVLGPNVLAVIAGSETYPTREVESARRLARKLGVRLRFIHTYELKNQKFTANSPERCYYCKKELFGRLKDIAAAEKIPFVLDGANFDDRLDYRPGGRAGSELGIRSPLKDAGLTKSEIRTLSRRFGLPTWDKPSMACLASRFPYGTRIEKKGLGQVGRAEDVLRKFGFGQLRVRHHGSIARVEVGPAEFPRLIKSGVRDKVVRGLKKLGYLYVTIDLEGYRTGSLNEALGRGKLRAGKK